MCVNVNTTDAITIITITQPHKHHVVQRASRSASMPLFSHGLAQLSLSTELGRSTHHDAFERDCDRRDVRRLALFDF